MSLNKQKILCPRFDTLGDIVLLEGFIETLKVSQPDIEITLVVRRGCDQLAELFPPELKLSWVSVDLEAYGEITQEHSTSFDVFLGKLGDNWDLILFSAFNFTWLDCRLSEYFIDVSQVVLGDTDTFQWWSTSHAIPIAVKKNIHEIDKYAELSQQFFGINYALSFPRLVVSTENKLKASAVLEKLEIAGGKYAVIFPTGTRNQSIKAWPLDRFADVISWIVEEKHIVPLLLGHVSEGEIVCTLSGMLKTRGINAVQWLGNDGELSQLAAILERSCFYVGNDTGPMHIAAALGVPTVGIFGGGHGFRFLPVGLNSIGIIGNMPCFNCGWDCIFGDAPCKLMVDVDAVKKAITLVLSDLQLSSNLLNVEQNLPVILPELINKFKSERVRLLGLVDAVKNERNSLLELGKLKFNKSELNYDEELHKAHLTIEALQSSFCWRITKPLRTLNNWALKWRK